MTELNMTTVSAVAAKIDHSIGWVSGILKGRKIPSDEALPRYAEFLGISLEETRALVLKEREARAAKRDSHSEARTNFERAIIEHTHALALASLGVDDARGRGKPRDHEAALEDARDAYEAEITARALENISPRVLTLLRRMTPKQQACVERQCEAILNGDKVGIVVGDNDSTKRTDRNRERRTRRSRRLSATHLGDSQEGPSTPPPASTQ